MRPSQNISGEIAALEGLRQMKTRILTAAIAIPLLLIVILALPKIFAAILFGLMCVLAAYELQVAAGLVKNKRLVIYAMVMAMLVALWSYFGCSRVWAVAGILVFSIVLFAELMINHIKLRFEKIAICLVAGVLIPFLFSGIIRILAVDGSGRFFVLIPFVIAFLSDTGAYFAGLYLGSHKLAPVISPKKTVEGAVGGIFHAIHVEKYVAGHRWLTEEGLLVNAMGATVEAEEAIENGTLIKIKVLGAKKDKYGSGRTKTSIRSCR